MVITEDTNPREKIELNSKTSFSEQKQIIDDSSKNEQLRTPSEINNCENEANDTAQIDSCSLHVKYSLCPSLQSNNPMSTASQKTLVSNISPKAKSNLEVYFNSSNKQPVVIPCNSKSNSYDKYNTTITEVVSVPSVSTMIRAPSISRLKNSISFETKYIMGASSYDDIFVIARKTVKSKSCTALTSTSDPILQSRFCTSNFKLIPNTEKSCEPTIVEDKMTCSSNSGVNICSKETVKSIFHTCSGQVTIDDFPSGFNEILDRLTSILDSAVKRIEVTVSKEIGELKKFVEMLQQDISTPHVTLDEIKTDEITPSDVRSHKDTTAKDSPEMEADLVLEKDSTINQFFDHLKLKLNMDITKRLLTPSISVKEFHTSEIFQKYFAMWDPYSLETAEKGEDEDEIKASELPSKDVDDSISTSDQWTGPSIFIRNNTKTIRNASICLVMLLYVYLIITFVR